VAVLRIPCWLLFPWVLAAICLPLSAARALDKQASAHGGSASAGDEGFGISSSLLAGIAVYNPTYAARPDNTGRALLRLAPHVDIDLLGPRLSIPIDINFFTDRNLPGFQKLVPSELDLISGVTSTWPVGLAALELGVRGEVDLPLNEPSEAERTEDESLGYKQAYVDARTRLLLSGARFWPGLRQALAGGDVSGAATLGWFAFNPSYAARPDNTGRALLRYAFHLTLDYAERVFVGVDATMFTDRRSNPVAPSELDFTAEIGAHIGLDVALHVAYERDMPIDRGGVVQHFLMAFATWDFTWLPAASPKAKAPPKVKSASQPG
jgi:hypothetical protein